MRTIQETESREHDNRSDMMGERERRSKDDIQATSNDSQRGMVVLFMRPGTEKDKAGGMAVFQETHLQTWMHSFINKHF